MTRYLVGLMGLLAFTLAPVGLAASVPDDGRDARSAASAPDTSTASGCSKATAREVVERLRLGEPTIADPIGNVLCGAFTGRGSRAMVVVLRGPGNTGFVDWVVFRWVEGAWQFVMKQPAGASITAAGSDIRQTLPIYRPADARCCPTGGTKTRLWRWNGTRLVAGPWKQVTRGAAAEALIFSPLPDGPSCLMRDDGSLRGSWVYCWIGPSERRATLHVKMGVDGRLDLASTIPETLGKGGPSLRYGSQVTVGRFRCLSLRAGVRCTVVRSGKGFLISSTTVGEIVP